jgi:hypothetical protein
MDIQRFYIGNQTNTISKRKKINSIKEEARKI